MERVRDMQIPQGRGSQVLALGGIYSLYLSPLAVVTGATSGIGRAYAHEVITSASLDQLWHKDAADPVALGQTEQIWGFPGSPGLI